MLGHFLSETTGRDIATAALISRAMKVALMTEPNQIGNGEPWNGLFDIPTRALSGAVKKQEKNDNLSSTDRLFCRFQPHARLALDICRCGFRRDRRARYRRRR